MVARYLLLPYVQSSRYNTVRIPGICGLQVWGKSRQRQVYLQVHHGGYDTALHWMSDPARVQHPEVMRGKAHRYMITVPPLAVFLDDGPSSAKCSLEFDKGMGYSGKYFRRTAAQLSRSAPERQNHRAFVG